MGSIPSGDSIAGPSNSPEDDDFGADIEIDEELESILVQAESQAVAPELTEDVIDIEDAAPRISPIQQFRKKGWLSVSDLVGTVWCEVQYDYRLRTLPYLPPDQRPKVIKSKDGVAIPVDNVKVEGKERILRRGEKIHKRLEREIHPEEIVVHAVTREDVWGLRFLNMFSALEALLTLGKCRELPVVGFVQGVLVMGVIIRREPVNGATPKRSTRSSAPDTTQTALTSFFSPTKPQPARRERTHRLFVSDSKTRASGTIPNEGDTLAGRLQVMLYKELLDALLLPPRSSDDPSETPHDAALPTEYPFSWERLFQHLDLDMDAALSESFLVQSRPIISGNALRFGVREARTLRDMIRCWMGYVEALGLGIPDTGRGKAGSRNTARTEDRLELVYRRAGGKKRDKESTKSGKGGRKAGPQSGSSRSKRKKQRDDEAATPDPAEMALEPEAKLFEVYDKKAAVRQAIEESLGDLARATQPVETNGAPSTSGKAAEDADQNDVADPEQDAEDDELAWAVEMSLGANADEIKAEENGEVVLRASQANNGNGEASPASSTPSTPSPTKLFGKQAPDPSPQTKSILESSAGGSGSIIGRTVFTHSPRRLATHLASVLQWWLGEREAVGVPIEETRRCGWCEFEEGCEWRAKKALEATQRMRAART